MATLIQPLRPKQWVKNFIVFAALIFSGEFVFFHRYPPVLLTFAAFCMISSAGYILNDLLDLKSDRQHPVKKNRALAAGIISVPAAAALSLVLAGTGIAACFAINAATGLAAAGYAAVTIAYSVTLKHIVLVDVLTIAGGFVLRAIAGACAISVPISPWLVVCTVLLSLFLGLHKRRHELELLGEAATEHRRNLAHYSVRTIDVLCRLVTVATIVTYTIYTVHQRTIRVIGTPYLLITVPLVAYGLLRYAHLATRKNDGGDPSSVLLKDRPLLVTVALWTLLVCLIVLHGHTQA